MSDMISIIMPSYNSEKYIKKSIESVIKQTYIFWELIIIDDCSSDNTINIISEFKDERIRLIQNTENSGAAISRNKGLKLAKGKYVAFLDSDDIWADEKLSTQVDFMEKNNYDFTFTDYRICKNGQWDKYVITGPKVVTYRKNYNYCYFSTITVMYNREKVGLIQIKDLKKNNDYAMWFEALKKTKAYRLPLCLSYYIKHENSISSGKKLKLIKHHYILFKEGLSKNTFLSIIFTINNIFHGIFKKLIYKKKINEEE